MAGRGVRGGPGEQIHGAVLGAVRRLPGLLPVLSEATGAHSCALDQDLRGWAALLAPEEHPTEQQLLTRLLQLAMVHAVVGNEAVVEISQPVELVQISAHTKNALSEYSITAQDKLGGWSVHRFGGFLKRSWRVNDWIWGRLDAATMLSRAVLHPRHIRRAAVLSGYLSLGADPQDRADQTLAEVLRLLPPGAAQDPRLVHCRSKAAVELRGVLNPQVPVGDLPASLPGLADLFAAALHLDIVPDELPALGVAIGADRLAGANPRSNGEGFLLEHPHLLNRRRSTRPGRPASPYLQVRASPAFRAFDRAGIGREPLPEELSSDLMLRVATTAAAVGVTVVVAYLAIAAILALSPAELLEASWATALLVGVDSVGDDSPAERYAVHLVAAGIGLRCWTTPHSGDHPGAPLLTRQGAKVFDLVCEAAGDRSCADLVHVSHVAGAASQLRTTPAHAMR